MRIHAGVMAGMLLGLGLVAYVQNQSEQSTTPATSTAQASPNQAPNASHEKCGQTGQGARHEVGSGSADIGKGAAKGAGNVAAGAGKGGVDLVTLHPINAAGAVGTGAAKGGKNIATGAVKGTGKIANGTGKAIKHVF